MSKLALSIKNLNVSYGQTPALKNLCLDVLDKEFLGILGPNGGGKTSLLKSILGLIPKRSGEILVYGQSIKNNKIKIGYVPQLPQIDRAFPISAEEVVLCAMIPARLKPFFSYTPEDIDRAHQNLADLGIETIAKKQISQLSGGEFQKLLISRALAIKPQILLLDEPTASVDPHSKDHLYDLLEKINKHITIVMVSHDLLAVSTNVTRIACINQGIIYHGEPELTENVINEMYGCPVDLIAHGVPHRVLSSHKGGSDHC
jgi:zinc transport system ATP-binding protein